MDKITFVENNDILRVEALRLYFQSTRGPVQAVDDVSLNLKRNEAMVIIGESGCGKSSLARAILRLLPRNVAAYSGKVYLNGSDLMRLSDEEFRQQIRWVRMSLVPQAAMNALNPVLKVGDQVAEPARVHLRLDDREALHQAKIRFEQVGVPVEFAHRYAFELSGGMRQRAAIAMALVTLPDLIILDEPTSALDVLTQASIFNLLKRVKKELQTSFILITHDIATSSELADRVAVMYAGQIVEVADAFSFFARPLHPYAEKLMASVPRLRGNADLEFITGQPPSLVDPPAGCRFAERCPAVHARCSQEPPMVTHQGRQVKCWLYVRGESDE